MLAIGPCIGPIIGGFLTVAKGWRWNFWLVSILVSVEDPTYLHSLTYLGCCILYNIAHLHERNLQHNNPRAQS